MAFRCDPKSEGGADKVGPVHVTYAPLMVYCHLHSSTIIRAAFINSEAVLARSALPWHENSAYQLCATGVL